MAPKIVKDFLLAHKEGQSFFCLEINASNNIIEYFGEAEFIGIKTPQKNEPLIDYLPILLPESLDSNFEIPFYNISEDHVCHIYFLKQKTNSYLVLVDKSEIFKATKKYQQFAHEDNISKNKFKRIAQQLAKAQKQLKQSNQEKSTLIAMLSHELGTPLTSIIGYSELLLSSNTKGKKGLEIIHRNALYLKHMIENTLMFGQSEAGGLNIQTESISIQKLFNRIKTILLPSAMSKKLELQMFHKGNENINIDITRTQQILINLLNNAVKYTDSGSVELKFSIIKGHYIFSIIDTGLGIAQDLQTTIFKPWERLEENAESGSGIGLFISQKLAQAIGGEVRLKYSSKEYGSIFQLCLPENSEPVETLIDKKQTTNPCLQKSLLVIDDDYDILELIKALLKPSGLNIHTAIDFNMAGEILNKVKVDIVLTDYHLGKQKAKTFIKPFKEQYANTPIVLMTAMPTSKNKLKYKALGFDDIITKPLNGNTLLASIIQNIE